MGLSIYWISILLLILPLGYIAVTQQIQKYFVYVVVTFSFMVLNLLGSVSPHITAYYHDIKFNMIFLQTALFFHLLFWVLFAYTKAYPVPVLTDRLNHSFKSEGSSMKTYLKFCLGVSFVGMIIFASTVSMPFFLRADLFTNAGTIKIGLNQFPHLMEPGINHAALGVQQKLIILGAPPGKLIDERMNIITARAFHWFALCAFELPLFLVSLASVCFFLSRSQSSVEQKKWRTIFINVSLFAAIASLWILSKQYLIYLMALFFMVLMIFKNRIDIKILLYGSVAIFTTLGMLYIVYDHSIPNQFIYLLFATLFHRIVEIYPWSAAVAFDMFPKDMAFLGGRSMINLFHLFNFKPVSVANLIYTKIYGFPHGSCPLPAVFESYVNWGWSGVFVTNLIIVLTVFGVSVLSWSRNIWFFSLSCYLAIKLILFWQSPLWYGVYEPTLVFFVGLMCLFYGVWKRVFEKKLQLRILGNAAN